MAKSISAGRVTISGRWRTAELRLVEDTDELQAPLATPKQGTTARAVL